ncbi:hypothetical protein ACI5KX_00260 [Erythrobacter sp. GH1-10]|uniref:hypothetical protein n=1 Tax=Erythrobacter sp. GH1-10 TaxID=3349334 RepID=UPI0038783335
MNKPALILATSIVALGLASCAGQQRRGPPPQVIDRALKGAPGEAQPSTIVATESAFARAAREQGQWTAFREFAAPGALIHGRNGTIVAEPWLAQQSDPESPVQWGPRTVVMSCDGATAVSVGRFQTPEGIVGNFVTVWERQSDRDYKWVYDVGGPDVPQPPPRKQFEDGDIVVTAIDAVQGLVATCPRAGETVPPPPALSLASDNPGAAKLSRDGTLRWRWEHLTDGRKFVSADYFFNGRWVTAVEETLASGPEE